MKLNSIRLYLEYIEIFSDSWPKDKIFVPKKSYILQISYDIFYDLNPESTQNY